MIEPVSWNELQVIVVDHMKTIEKLSLSDSCPTELAAFEQLDAKSTFFKEILWTEYFWTEFKNVDGLTCIVKHDTFDFFSQSENTGPLKTPQFEILTVEQSMVLLSAADSMGFDEIGIETLKRHVHFHNQAVQDQPFAKYGGLVRMANFMMQNPKDTPTIVSSDKNFANLDKRTRILVDFEAQFSQETLSKLIQEVAEENKSKTSEQIYPFNSFEELLNQTQEDIKSKKKVLNNKQSSYLYQIRNDQIFTNNYTAIYPYSSIGYLINRDRCSENSWGGTDFLITSYVTLTAAHNIVCNNNYQSNNVFSLPGALRSGSGFTTINGAFTAENVKKSYLYDASDNLNFRAQFDYGVLRSEEQFNFTTPITLQIDPETKKAVRKSTGYVTLNFELLQKSAENEINIDFIKELVNEK